MLSAISTIKGEAFKAITGSDAAKNAVKVPGMIATETLSFAQLRAAGASNAAAAVITASGVIGQLTGTAMAGIVGAVATGPAAPLGAAVAVGILGAAAGRIGGDIGTSLGGIIANAFGLPVVVDLDGDGVDLVALTQSRTFFDMRGDGFREHTGWVGPGDGLLVVDPNHNGQVDDINEISFARFGAPGATDLEGLAAGFDSNHDGVIDARDARFGELMVWQDANQNGQTDAGELKSLTERGITSIGLDRRSPASVETPNAFENFLFGTSTFTRADGSVGAVGDVALGFVNSGLRSEPATGDGVGWLRDESGGLIEVITGPITGNIQPPAGDVVGVIGSSAAEQLTIPGTQGVLLAGEGGNDALTGGAGDDWLIGGAGSDSLSGGPGDDVLFIDDVDRQTDIDGGDGKDMVIVGGATGVTFDLGAAHVEMAKGGEGNDTLLTTGADPIIANGGAGNDVLEGGPGDDLLGGGPGADVLVGGAGDDILVIDGQDSVDAGAGTDTVIIDDPAGVTLDLAAVHAELAFGGSGDDVLQTSGTSGVLLYGGGGDDRLQGGQGDDGLYGGEGNDLLLGGAGDDVLDGGAGDDLAVFTGEFAGYELFRSGTSAAVRDTNPADGNDGTDFVINVERLAFADRIVELDGTNSALASGADAVPAAVEVDPTQPLALAGSAGQDTLRGGPGDDPSRDLGVSLDAIEETAASGAAPTGPAGPGLAPGDPMGSLLLRIGVDGEALRTPTVDPHDALGRLVTEPVQSADMSTVPDHSVMDHGVALTGAAGAETLKGTQAGDGLTGLAGGLGGDTSLSHESEGLDPGAPVAGLGSTALADVRALSSIEGATGGQERVGVGAWRSLDQMVARLAQAAGLPTTHLRLLEAEHRAILAGTEGPPGTRPEDVLHAGTGHDTLHGGAADDALCGGDGHDVLDGHEGDDLLVGGAGHDTVHGGPGDDALYGKDGHDVLVGGQGDDLLDGGAGHDRLEGGEGADRLTACISCSCGMMMLLN